MGKFGNSSGPKSQGAQPNNVASLDAARRARQAAAEQQIKDQAAAWWNKVRAEQIHMPFPADSPLGRALENAVSSALPYAPPDDVTPLTEKTVLNPQVPQGKAGE